MKMAPPGSSATSSRIKTRRKLKPRRSHSLQKKKKNPQSNIKNEEMNIASTPSCCSNNGCTQMILGEADISDDSSSGCSTPKAQRFRIPQVSTCPPPPKKPKSISNCSFHRSPIPFFASPELEMFFLRALRDISV